MYYENLIVLLQNSHAIPAVYLYLLMKLTQNECVWRNLQRVSVATSVSYDGALDFMSYNSTKHLRQRGPEQSVLYCGC